MLPWIIWPYQTVLLTVYVLDLFFQENTFECAFCFIFKFLAVVKSLFVKCVTFFPPNRRLLTLWCFLPLRSNFYRMANCASVSTTDSLLRKAFLPACIFLILPWLNFILSCLNFQGTHKFGAAVDIYLVLTMCLALCHVPYTEHLWKAQSFQRQVLVGVLFSQVENTGTGRPNACLGPHSWGNSVLLTLQPTQGWCKDLSRYM